MRISDLSRKSGVPVATIKFYLREKLLPPGTPTGRNQASYDDTHLKQLMLIRSLTTIARLDLSSVRELLVAVDDERVSLSGLYEVTDRAMSGAAPQAREFSELEQARSDVAGLLASVGWKPGAGAPAAERLAHVIAALRLLGCGCGTDFLLPYAQAAEHFARVELDLVPQEMLYEDRAAVVTRSILLGVASAALRRLAHEHVVVEGRG